MFSWENSKTKYKMLNINTIFFKFGVFLNNPFSITMIHYSFRI